MAAPDAASAASLMFTVHTVEWTLDKSELHASDCRVQMWAGKWWVWLTQAHSLTVCDTCRGGGRPRRCGVRSLKVVVQRALIELPGSLRRRCSVEGREEDEGGKEERGTRRSCRLKREPLRDQDEADSQLVTCQSCDITVHRGESAS